MALYHQIDPENNPSILLDGCVADSNLEDTKLYQQIRAEHGSKPYDIVPFAELMDIYENGYPSRNVYYVKLERFLKRETDQTEDDIVELLIVLHNEIAFGADFDDIFTILNEEGLIFSTEASQRLLLIFQDVINHTCTYYNCGYSPTDLHRVMSSGQQPSLPKTIIPMSTEAAKLMEQVKPEIEKLGIKLDLNAAAVVPAKGNDKKNRKPGKIYPNDLCPCGSGKKYKKCCGR